MNDGTETTQTGGGVAEATDPDEKEDAAFNAAAAGRAEGKSFRTLSGAVEDAAGGSGTGGGETAEEKAAREAGENKGGGADGAGGGSDTETDEQKAAREAAEKEAAGTGGAGGETAEQKAAREAAEKKASDTTGGAGGGKGGGETAEQKAEREAAENVARRGGQAALGGIGPLTSATVDAHIQNFRKSLEPFGELVLEPASADGKEKAVTVKSFDEGYGGVAKRIDLAVAVARQQTREEILRELMPTLQFAEDMRQAKNREDLIAAIDGEGEGKIVGGRAMATSKDFREWFVKQPDQIKRLGDSPDRGHAVKLLRLFQAETKFVIPGAAADEKKTGGRSKEDRSKLLDSARAGGSGSRTPDSLGEVLARSGGEEIRGISEEKETELADLYAKQQAEARK